MKYGDKSVTMLRFFSKRMGRNAQKYKSVDNSVIHNRGVNKNAISCKVMLLDDTDIAVELPVSIIIIVYLFCYVKLISLKSYAYSSY